MLPLPLTVGTHTVEAALRGDRLYEAASANKTLKIRNSAGALLGALAGDTVKVALAVLANERGVRGAVELKLRTELLRLTSLTGFGAAKGTIWVAGATHEGRELLLRIVHEGRKAVRVSVWSGGASAADEPASGELLLR